MPLFARFRSIKNGTKKLRLEIDLIEKMRSAMLSVTKTRQERLLIGLDQAVKL